MTTNRERLDGFLQAIDEHQKETERLKIEAFNFVRTLIECADDASKKEVATVIYWHYDKLVRPKDLATLLGFHANQLAEFVDDGYLNSTCSDCGCEIAIKIFSRSHLAETLKATHYCSSCYAIRRKETAHQEAVKHAEYEKAAQAREARLEQLRTMPYRQYLQTPEWEEIRNRKMRRARFACELCATKGKLNVHHKTYERRGQEDDKDLIVLCANCHAKFHDKLPGGA